jgi:site-specific recombinase XerD
LPSVYTTPGRSQGPERLTREIVRGFLALLHRREVSTKTVVRKLSAIKSFIGWLRSEDIVEEEN